MSTPQDRLAMESLAGMSVNARIEALEMEGFQMRDHLSRLERDNQELSDRVVMLEDPPESNGDADAERLTAVRERNRALHSVEILTARVAELEAELEEARREEDQLRLQVSLMVGE